MPDLARRRVLLVPIAAIVALAAALTISTQPRPGHEPTESPAATRSSMLPGSSGEPAPIARATPVASHGAAEQAFADAFLALADDHNRACTEILLANPLAEFDLVGTRLTDEVIDTRGRLASLPPLPSTRALVSDLDSSIADVIAVLESVDPHGPRVDQAMAYQMALDQWIARVQPISDEIRVLVGLPNATTGDLRL